MNHTNYEANNIILHFLILYLEKKLHICKNFETQACAVAFAVAVIVGAVAVVWAVVVEHFGVANAVGAVTALAWKSQRQQAEIRGEKMEHLWKIL